MKNFKRTIPLILAIAVVSSLLSVSIFATSGYSVTVDGVVFDCEENKSGEGWSYNAGTKTLTLNGYNGSSVVAGGNINIIINGSTAINGTASSTYSSSCCGIFVNGTLTLTVGKEATARINGAENTTIRGGDGIVATSLVLSSFESSSLEVKGGYSESAAGGFAIKANTVKLETKNLVAKGGNNSSALYFATNLHVSSGSSATFVSGGTKISAITYLSNADYDLDGDIRSVFSNNGSTVYFSSLGIFKYGDINRDGHINTKDAVLLAQYLAGWKLELNESALSAADVYYDGSIDSKDAVLLAQYLASWSGITLGK